MTYQERTQTVTMKGICILLLCFGMAAARNCYGNHNGLTETDVILLVMNDLDKDESQQVTETEFIHEFITNYDQDRNGRVEEHEFIHEWHSRYHDDKEFPRLLFHVLRVTSNQYLVIENVPAMMAKFDINGDQRLSYGEVHEILMKLYRTCIQEP
ncbi:uncharacterized protein LOC121366919 [Gigantopelta aegis]|uniref:uncharacterized protein LOC121366919 n=1 Tax=Gigantopelta aegis TaxID=1735272 RepID=UPI001B887E05|nr:uncharacterized protein LOC121366919 [Gigantopelta aegis]